MWTKNNEMLIRVFELNVGCDDVIKKPNQDSSHHSFFMEIIRPLARLCTRTKREKKKTQNK